MSIRKKNHLWVIGYTGIKRAYLNVTKEEAFRRYNESEGEKAKDDIVKCIEFDDEFEVYDAWDGDIAFVSWDPESEEEN